MLERNVKQHIVTIQQRPIYEKEACAAYWFVTNCIHHADDEADGVLLDSYLLTSNPDSEKATPA